VRVAGVDGCKDGVDSRNPGKTLGGWVAVIVEPDGSAHATRLSTLADLFDRPLPPNLAAIDMPIGLPERIEANGRAPERLVRARLGQRQSSVFSMPSRAAVYASVDETVAEEERYRHACAVALETSTPPRKVSRQGFALFPRIIEIDRWLRANPAMQPWVFECHPEVSFWAMNDKVPLNLPKKVKGIAAAPGLELRRRLLAGAGFPPELLSPLKARELRVGEDDLLDACAAAWTAGRIARHTATSFPSPPERDTEGLPIAIWA